MTQGPRPMSKEIQNQIALMAQNQAQNKVQDLPPQGPQVQKPIQQEPQTFDDQIKAEAMKQLFGQIAAPKQFKPTDIAEGFNAGQKEGGIFGGLGGIAEGVKNLAGTSDFRNIMAALSGSPESKEAYMNKAKEAEMQEAGRGQAYAAQIASQKEAQMKQFNDIQKDARDKAMEMMKAGYSYKQAMDQAKEDTRRALSTTGMQISSAEKLEQLGSAEKANQQLVEQVAKTDPAKAALMEQAFRTKREQIAKGKDISGKFSQEKEGGFIKNLSRAVQGKGAEKSLKFDPFAKKVNKNIAQNQGFKKV